jgi:hypothetical protein
VFLSFHNAFKLKKTLVKTGFFEYKESLDGLHLAQAPDGASYGGSGSSAESVGAAGLSLPAALAVPDANSNALHGIAPAESASVGSMLSDLNLLDLLPQGGTIAGTVPLFKSYTKDLLFPIFELAFQLRLRLLLWNHSAATMLCCFELFDCNNIDFDVNVNVVFFVVAALTPLLLVILLVLVRVSV